MVDRRTKRRLAIGSMFVCANLAVILLVIYRDLVFGGTFLILFSFSLYYYEINKE